MYVGAGRQGAILGNNIGTTSDGLHAAGNAFGGMRVAVNADQITSRSNLIAYNCIGGVQVDGSNIIVLSNTLAANGGSGLAIAGVSMQLVVGNKIGTSADGLLRYPNTGEGILISGGTGILLSSNLVAYNGKAGIAITATRRMH